MKHIHILLVVSLFFTSCASNNYQAKSLPNASSYKIKYIIEYPSYKGIPKADAKNKRKKFLNKVMTKVLISIYRMGDYKKNSGASYMSNRTNFKLLSISPLVAQYTNNGYESRDGIYKPIIFSKNHLIIPPVKLQKYFEGNFPLLKRSDMRIAMNKFNTNYGTVGGVQLFNKFLKDIQFSRIVSKAPETNPSIYHIFKSYKNVFPSGMGVAEEEINEKNTLKFVLNKYKHYPYNKSTLFMLNYDPVSFLWGIVHVLNSNVEIKRINKKTLEVIVSVPVDEILKKYNIKNVNEFIE